MARRRKSGTGGASMDSLLDTMTNVVGILVIMLVVTQLGVQDAVRRITGAMTDEEFAEAEQDKAALDKLLDLEKEKLDSYTDDEARVLLTIEQQKALIVELERRIAALEDAKLDPDKLQAELDAQAKVEADLAKQIDTRSTEIASLKARLEETPAGPTPDAKIVNLPNPRAAPPKAEAVEFLVKDRRVYPVDDVEALQQRAMQEINTAQKKLGMVRDPENPNQLRIDGAKLQQHFEEKFIGDRMFQLKIAISGGRPQLVLVPRESAGTEERRLKSGFASIIRKHLNAPRFLRFRVYPDSFETYIEARNATDRVGVPAGWLPVGEKDEYRIGLGNKTPILVAGYTPPPPRPPTPPDPNRPPPPPKSDVD